MTHDELLEMEYKEQYNQYRWIGQMQSFVLTFYGVVVGFSFVIIGALSPGPVQLKLQYSIDYRWLALVLVCDGLLGVFVGIAIFCSRSMQRRTAWYQICLLTQMVSAMDTWVTEQSALRYRVLCTGGPRFSLRNTINTTFFIALVSGEAFFISGIVMFLKKPFGFLLEWVIIGTVVFLVLAVILTWRVTQYCMDKETNRMRCNYRKAERARGLEEIRKEFGLPETSSTNTENQRGAIEMSDEGGKDKDVVMNAEEYYRRFSGKTPDPESEYRKALEYALEERRFEIKLYWDRAKYFWTLVAVALGGYFTVARTMPNDKETLFIIGCLGLVFTFVWYAVSRAGSLWHLRWDAHIGMLEEKVVGPLHRLVVSGEITKFWRLGAYPFSGTRVHEITAIYLMFVWIFLALKAIIAMLSYELLLGVNELVFSIATLFFGIFILGWGKRRPIEFKKIRKTEMPKEFFFKEDPLPLSNGSEQNETPN